jgi:hypothetical protein
VAGIELVLPLKRPPRSAQRIASLRGRFTAVVPGREESFEFRDLPGSRNRVEQRGGVKVVLEQVRKNRATYEFRIRLILPQENESFQSHLDWAANNLVFLVAPDGTRIENPNYERYSERPNEIGMAYLFAVPGDLKEYALVYRTPAALINLPVEYELRDLELP